MYQSKLVRYFLVLLMGFIGTHGYAQTDISEGEVSGTWSLVNSPYSINGEITIPNDSTLIIEPGVQIVFTGNYKFKVQGRLLAIGTEQDSIFFTAQDNEAGWHGIKVRNISSSNDSTIFEHCIFQYGKANTSSGIENRAGGAISTNINMLRISHCLFQNNMTFSTNILESAGGAIAIGGGGPIIEDSEFRENESVYGAAMVINGSSTDPLIRNNHFHDNNGHGLLNIGGGASPILINNLIEHNHSTVHGILHFADAGGRAVLINNTIVNNTCSGQGGAIFVNHGKTPLFINNIIVGNSPAQVRLETASGLDFYNCLIEGGESGFSGASFTGTYQDCLDSDPLFIDEANDDYHLSDSSPCISAAADSIQLGLKWYYAPSMDFEDNPRPNPAGSVPDIGAFENELGDPATHVDEDSNQLPQTCELMQNYPNPFNPETIIPFQVNQTGRIVLKVFDVLGREIQTLVDDTFQQGHYQASFQADNLPTGIYFYSMNSQTKSEVRKMMLVR
ncbi:right-handed parallel beta-helix repeat-containing protein [candidate division KSB1 bacterium]|nr:right-handed parallel beta-helix repeat-containing protein [candidate division KSB1 bacterium]